MTYRLADHPIAADKAAVHFALWQTLGDAARMNDSIANQRYLEVARLPRGASQQAKDALAGRKKAKKQLQARHYGIAPSGVWTFPHAVSLRDPFATACGAPYLGGMQVPSVWEGPADNRHETRWFELLDPREKCLGCAGAIGADPTV